MKTLLTQEPAAKGGERRFPGLRGWMALMISMSFGSFAAPPCLAEDPLDTWHWRNPTPQGLNLTSVAHGAGRYVAATGSGQVITSTDGESWETVSVSAKDLGLERVRYLNGRFYLLGQALFSSTDGLAWEQVGERFVELNSPRDIAWGNGVFVILLTQEGRVLTSTDAVNWRERSTPVVNKNMEAITFGRGRFVAVGQRYDTQAAAILTSTDGTRWSMATLPTRNTGLLDVAYHEGLFVAVGGAERPSSPPLILTSTDGQQWIERAASALGSLRGVAGGERGFVAVGDRVLTSSDGIRWRDRDLSEFSAAYTYSPADPDFEGLVFTDLGAVAVGAGGKPIAVGSAGLIATDEPGEDWRTVSEAVTTSQLRGIASGAGRIVAVARDGSVLSSPDGVSWEKHVLPGLSDPPPQPGGVGFDGGRFAIFALWTGDSWTSADGIDWRHHKSSEHNVQIEHVTGGEEGFVAVGSQGEILWSERGPSITTVRGTSGGLISRVAYGNGKFVASPISQSQILVSENGRNWSSHFVAGNVRGFHSVAFGGGEFVAVALEVDNRGEPVGWAPYRSSDALRWRRMSLPEGYVVDPWLLVRGRDRWLFNGARVAGDGTDWSLFDWMLLSTVDGREWGKHPVPVGARQLSRLQTYATYANDTVLIVREGGGILQSAEFGTSELEALRLVKVTREPSERLVLHLANPDGAEVAWESSIDLSSWVPFDPQPAVVHPGEAVQRYLLDPTQLPAAPKRFFRAVQTE